jgi:hypothetical protein
MLLMKFTLRSGPVYASAYQSTVRFVAVKCESTLEYSVILFVMHTRDQSASLFPEQLWQLKSSGHSHYAHTRF